MQKRDPLSFLESSLPELTHRHSAQWLTEKWIGQAIENYYVEEYIGAGTYGVVFKGRRTTPFERTVAIKLLPNLRGQAKAEEFKNECQALADLDHVNISKIYTAGLTEDGTPYLIMPFLDGIPIDEYVDRNHCNFNEIADQMLQLSAAVAYAHSRGVIHCDLKPDNIIVDETGCVTVTDFGLAVRIDDLTDLTQRPSWAPGTIGYAAPEILISRQQATAAVDVYSLGAILYRLLTGEPPHQCSGWLDTLLASVSSPPARVQSLNPKVSDELAKVCDRCLAQIPSERYPSGVELKNALAGLVHSPESTTRSSPVQRSVIALAGAIVVAFLGWLFLLNQDGGRSSSDASSDTASKSSLLENRVTDSLTEQQVDWILAGIEEQLLRPGLKDPAKPGDFEETYEILQDAANELDLLLEMAPNHKTVRHRTATGYFLLARSAHWLRKRDYAEKCLDKSEEMFRQLNEDYPDDGYLFDFFHTVLLQSTLYCTPFDRREMNLKALGLIQGLHFDDPDNLDYSDAMACTLVLLAEDYSMFSLPENEDFGKARAYANEGLELAEWTFRQPDSKPIHRKQIIQAHSVLSYIAHRHGDNEKSLELAKKAWEGAIELDNDMQIVDTIDRRFDKTWEYAAALRRVGQSEKAERFLEELELLLQDLRDANWADTPGCEARLCELKKAIAEEKGLNH